MESNPSSSNFSPSAAREDVPAEAGEWICRVDAGLDAVEQREFARWLEDPRHASEFNRLKATWNSLDRLAELWPAGRIAQDPDFAPPSRRKIFWLAPALLAAAMVVVALLLQRPTPNAASSDFQRGLTAVGEQRQLELSDGSVVQLNTDTAVSVNYSRDERRVRLQHGEAHFAVAKNPDRPFVVAVGGVAVRAVGTAFDVRLRADSVEVLVTEGKVRVDDAIRGGSLLPDSAAASPALLLAGQRVLIPLNPSAPAEATGISAPSSGEISRELAWRQGRLQFGPSPLREVVAEFNRYNRHQLVIADPQIGAFRIGGTFRPQDYENFVRVLEDNYGVQARRGPDATWLSRAK